MVEAAFRQLSDKLDKWLRDGVLMLPNLAAAVVIVLAFWILARVASNMVARLLRRATSYGEINTLLTRLVFFATLAAGIFIALGILQLEKTVTSLVAGAGVLTLIIGFAFQDLAANFIAGILLQLRQPFRQGHLVRTNDFYGTVEHIDLRNTIIHTLTGQIVHLPNKEVFQNPLENFSAAGRRRVDIPVTVPQEHDLDRAERIALAAVERVAGRDTSSPVEVFYDGIGGDTIAFTVRFWVFFRDRESDFLVARGEAVKRIKRAFDAEAASCRVGTLVAETADPTALTSPAAAPADSARDPH
jgi:small conductance mechanosensitive channel